MPSQFAHELINANPYAFLDEAGLEERRARAVSLAERDSGERSGKAGKTGSKGDRNGAARVLARHSRCHELHDLLMSLVVLPVSMAEQERARHWMNFYEHLEREAVRRRLSAEAAMLDCDGAACHGAGIVV